MASCAGGQAGSQPASSNQQGSVTPATPAFAVGTTTLPQATAGIAYSSNLTAKGGTQPFTWSITSGALPSGLSLASNGQISGTTGTRGTFAMTVQVVDQANETASQNLTLVVVAETAAGSNDGPATLPKAFINTEFPAQPNATILNVNSGNAADLQTKINTAAANCGANGAIVNVPAGATYTAPQYFNLPPTSCSGGARVVIQSASLASLPPQGTRVPAANTNMPTITNAQASISFPVFLAADNPSNPPAHYWLAGLEVTSNYPSSGGPEIALLVFGDYCNQVGGGGCPITAGMSAANLANDFTVDRCWIHGANISSDVLHGIRFTASNVAIEDSLISDIHDSFSSPGQSTGVSSDFSMGPVDIGNSEIASVTENIIFGGTDPTITNSVPSYIYIHHNYIHKPSGWLTANGGPYQPFMRNFLECKNCQRMLVEGNVFDTDVDNSLSASVQMTPRNANGRCPWCVVQDITLRYNRFSSLGDWISFLGANGNSSGGSLGPELPFKRGSIHDNIVENLNMAMFGGNGRWIQINDGDASSAGCSASANSPTCQLSDLAITHNSLVSDQAATATSTSWTLAGAPAPGSLGFDVNITNNIIPAGKNGFGSDAGATHPLTSFLNAQFSSYTFNNNAITGIATTGYSCSDFPSPIQNFCGTAFVQPTSMASLLFANYNNGIGGDYHLQSSSPYKNQASDGTDPGANVDVVNSFTTGATAGIGSMPAVLAISTTSLPAAIAGSGYSVNLIGAGGTRPYSWNLSVGTLPAGLTLNGSTGVISGTPVSIGNSQFTVQISDSASHTASQEYTLLVEMGSNQIAAAVQTTGKDERSNNYAQVAFPGYAQLRVSDGAAETEGYRSGLSVFWDLKNDPTALLPIEGQDCGLGLGIDYGYASNGVLIGSAESKCSPGSITVLESNNIRLVVEYDWTNTEGGPNASCAGGIPSSKCFATPGFTGHYIYTIYRAATGGAKVYGRMSFTNSTGATINMDSKNCPSGQFCDFQYNFPQSWTDFAGEGLQVPLIGIGYSDPYWQTIGTFAPRTPSPWGWGSDDEVNMTNIHFIMHSTGIPTAPTSGLRITDGSTTALNTNVAIPVKASFLEVTNDIGGTTASYVLQAFAGARSKIQVPGITIPSNGPDSLVRYAFWLGGDNGVVQEADAVPYANEFRSPPALTMNTGSSQSFSYDRGDFRMTASSNAVDFTVGGTLHSPEFTIANWATVVPSTIRLNGSTLTVDADYVAVVGGGTLELQILRQLSASDHVQIP